MGQQEQTGLPLINGLQASYKRAGSELLRVIKTVVVVGPPKRIVLAEDLGIREQHLSDALNDNGKNFDVRWLPGVVRYDREHSIAGLIASWQDCKVVEREPLSDKQKLDALRAELRESGANVEALEERAYRRTA